MGLVCPEASWLDEEGGERTVATFGTQVSGQQFPALRPLLALARSTSASSRPTPYVGDIVNFH